MSLQRTKGFFITGTDTGVGKSTVTEMLIRDFNRQGFKTIGCKPISCGSNEDGLMLKKANPISLDQDLINPFHFDLAVSPNIAAKAANRQILAQEVSARMKELLKLPVDYVLYEGLGGWKVPINDKESMIDIVKALNLDIILVVGIRVGCLNHALLTHESILKECLPLAGWIGNVIDQNTPEINQHIITLQQWLDAPYLGLVQYCKTKEMISNVDTREILRNLKIT